MAKAVELLEKKRNLTELPRDNDADREGRKTRKEEYQESGEIKIYPTELSYKYKVDNLEVVQGSCLREMYFKFHEVPETDPCGIEILETFELGFAVEEIIKKELKAIGELVEENEEVEVKQIIGSEGLLLSGRMDAVLNDGTIIEMKSFKGHEYTIELLKGSRGKKGMIMDAHIPQAAAYLASRKYSGEKDPTLIMWYKDRKSLVDILLEIKMDDFGNLTCNGEKIVKFNFQSCLDRADEFAKCIKNDTMPERDYGYYKPEEADDLLAAKLITYRVATRIGNGEKVLPFKCDVCRYKTLCIESEV